MLYTDIAMHYKKLYITKKNISNKKGLIHVMHNGPPHQVSIIRSACRFGCTMVAPCQTIHNLCWMLWTQDSVLHQIKIPISAKNVNKGPVGDVKCSRITFKINYTHIIQPNYIFKIGHHVGLRYTGGGWDARKWNCPFGESPKVFSRIKAN